MFLRREALIRGAIGISPEMVGAAIAKYGNDFWNNTKPIIVTKITVAEKRSIQKIL